MKITTVYSEMCRKAEHAPGSVQARIAADLDRFNGVVLFPSVVEQIRGHLRSHWGDGFTVELDDPGAGVVDYLPSASVSFTGSFESLVSRQS